MTKLIEEMSTRKPLGFYDKLIESNVANGTFSLLEPGVTQISDPNDNTKTITYRHVTVFSPLTSVGELYSAHGVDKLVGVIMVSYFMCCLRIAHISSLTSSKHFLPYVF